MILICDCVIGIWVISVTYVTRVTSVFVLLDTLIDNSECPWKIS